MSASPTMRRADKMMTTERALEALSMAFSGRLATVGEDGYPYCLPLLFVIIEYEIFVHNSSTLGHLRSNVDNNRRVCFEVDQSDKIYPYGRFECDTALAYWSVIAFGDIRVVEIPDEKKRFCDALMAKYADKKWNRPKGFYPRIDEISVYAIKVNRLTGKETILPASDQLWPEVDKTKSPNARP